MNTKETQPAQPPSVTTLGGGGLGQPRPLFNTLSVHSQLAAQMCAQAFQTNCRRYDDDDDDMDEDVSRERPPATQGQGREIWGIAPTVVQIKEKGLEMTTKGKEAAYS